jgi:ABC-2 type transport system permease protein
MTQLAEIFENPQIAVTGEDLEGVETQNLDNTYSYTTPSYAVMFAFFIVGIIAATIMAEKEAGTFRRLLASPIHRGSIIAGKMLAYILVVGLQVLLVLGVGNVFFNVQLGNSPLGLLLLTLALALAATSLGMLVAALARTRSQVDAVGMVIGIVLGAVGGAIIPIPEEGFLHVLSRFTPHAHAIEGYIKLMSQGAGVVDVIPQMGLLAGVGVMFFLIAMWRFRFE